MIEKDQLKELIYNLDHEREMDWNYLRRMVEDPELIKRVMDEYFFKEDSYEFYDHDYISHRKNKDGDYVYRRNKLYKDFMSFKRMIVKGNKKAVALLKEVLMEFLDSQEKLQTKDPEILFNRLIAISDDDENMIKTELGGLFLSRMEKDDPRRKYYYKVIKRVPEKIGYQKAYQWLKNNLSTTYSYDKHKYVEFLKLDLNIKEKYIYHKEVKDWLVKNNLPVPNEEFKACSDVVGGNFFENSYYGVTAEVKLDNGEKIEIKFLATSSYYNTHGGWN